MEKPELYSKGNDNITINRMILSKHWDFVRWGKDSESIFEAGMGDGKVTKEVLFPLLPGNIKEYIGSDISYKMVNFANTLINNSKLKIIQLDICDQDIPSEFHNRFDKVFACFLLHMLSAKVKTALENFYKILKPGGQLIYTTFDRLPMDSAYKQLDKKKWKKYHHSNAMSFFCDSSNPFEDYKNLTLEMGFQEDIITIINNCYLQAPNRNIMKGLRESVNVILKDVLPEERTEYLEEYQSLMDQSINFSEDKETGEQFQKVNVILAIVTKPVDG